MNNLSRKIVFFNFHQSKQVSDKGLKEYKLNKNREKMCTKASTNKKIVYWEIKARTWRFNEMKSMYEQPLSTSLIQFMWRHEESNVNTRGWKKYDMQIEQANVEQQKKQQLSWSCDFWFYCPSYKTLIQWLLVWLFSTFS